MKSSIKTTQTALTDTNPNKLIEEIDEQQYITDKLLSGTESPKDIAKDIDDDTARTDTNPNKPIEEMDDIEKLIAGIELPKDDTQDIDDDIDWGLVKLYSDYYENLKEESNEE